MDNPLYAQTVTVGGETTTYNAPKVLGIRIHADQSFDLQYTLVDADAAAFDIASSTSQVYVTAYKNVDYTPALLASGVNTDSGSGTTDRVTFTVPADAIPNDIANFPIRNPGNAVFYAIITDGAGKKIEIVAEVNIFDTQYSLTGDAAPSAQTIVPIKNDLGSVISSNLTTPPAATLNDAYIVGVGATGDWSGQDNALAIGTGSAWVFFTPDEGNFVYDENQNVQIIFDGSVWASLAGTPFSDADALIKNDADNTKLIGFDASGITTATERTITMPDTDVDLGDIATNSTDITNIETKTDFITVTQAVDLDTMESDISANNDKPTQTEAAAGTDNDQTGTTYTFVLTDQENKTVWLNNAAAIAVTVPTNASVAFPVGTKINVMFEGAGVPTITGDTGVTVNGTSGGSVVMNNQYQGATLTKRATDTWIVTGDIT